MHTAMGFLNRFMDAITSIILVSRADICISNITSTASTSLSLKTNGRTSYVEVFETPIENATSTTGVTSAVPPIQKIVEVGSSNDTSTEILSGLNEGDLVVSRTITSTVTAANSTPSLLNSLGGNRAGGVRTGGGIRIGQ